jgi:ATP-dependent DNA ligase
MALPRFDSAQLTLFRVPFDDPDFLFELKVDGFRALAYIDDGNCELVSRRRNPYKRTFMAPRASPDRLRVRWNLPTLRYLFSNTLKYRVSDYF